MYSHPRPRKIRGRVTLSCFFEGRRRTTLSSIFFCRGGDGWLSLRFFEGREGITHSWLFLRGGDGWLSPRFFWGEGTDDSLLDFFEGKGRTDDSLLDFLWGEDGWCSSRFFWGEPWDTCTQAILATQLNLHEKIWLITVLQKYIIFWWHKKVLESWKSWAFRPRALGCGRFWIILAVWLALSHDKLKNWRTDDVKHFFVCITYGKSKKVTHSATVSRATFLWPVTEHTHGNIESNC